MCGSSSYIPVKPPLSETKITDNLLEAKGARCAGLNWFQVMFPNGTTLAIALAACNNPNWISWALNTFGECK